MMKTKRLMTLFAVLSFFGIIYCLAVFIYSQQHLKPDVPPYPDAVTTLGYFVPLAYFVAGLYHVVMLVHALKASVRLRKHAFMHSLYIVLIILSGITLLSDITILSDIAKEYRIADIKAQWLMLYGFTLFHLAMLICGALYGRKTPTKGTRLFEEIKNGNDAMFLTIYQIAFICGLMGIGGVVTAMSGLISSVITEQYKVAYMLIMAGLALVPLITFTFFWVLKFRKKPLSDWFDEMQLHDTAIGALIAATVTLPLMIVFTIISFSASGLHGSFWLLFAFFVYLVSFSGTVLLRKRISE